MKPESPRGGPHLTRCFVVGRDAESLVGARSGFFPLVHSGQRPSEPTRGMGSWGRPGGVREVNRLRGNRVAVRVPPSPGFTTILRSPEVPTPAITSLGLASHFSAQTLLGWT